MSGGMLSMTRDEDRVATAQAGARPQRAGCVLCGRKAWCSRFAIQFALDWEARVCGPDSFVDGGGDFRGEIVD
ncbi:MAG: hypothetical protein IRY98_11525 [Alicyclobacillaceae bacterium]|nr:hypothetical protein [Alicyclobacillaceae bacterium]